MLLHQIVQNILIVHRPAWACVMLVVMVLALVVVIPVRMRVVQYVAATVVMLV